jgi:hypothetical protein
MTEENCRPVVSEAAAEKVPSNGLSSDTLPPTSPNDDARLSRPDSHWGRMQRVVLQVLLEHEETGQIPTNGRFVFYELEQMGKVRKSGPGELRRGGADDPREQDVIDALIYLRDHEVVPWDWIEDETRQAYTFRLASTVLDFVKDSIWYARINPWPGQPPLLLVESRSLGGVLYDLCADYLVSIAATNGQVGGFLRTDVAPLLQGNNREVLYLGDWDPQGHDIEANTRRVLEQATRREIKWTRIAITQEQIRERGLTSIWKQDKRFKPAKWYEAWETEALGQAEIVRLVRDELDRLLLPLQLEAVLERERVQREQIAAILDNLAAGDT